MNKSDLQKRLGLLIYKIKLVTEPQGKELDDSVSVSPELASNARTSGLALLGGMYGTDHQLYGDFADQTARTIVYGFKRALGIVKAVREQVDKDWLLDTRALVAADVFSDFLEMAEYLLQEGYKDPAAVIAGSTLEAHLRALAHRNGVPVESLDRQGKMRSRKAESLNQDLGKFYGLGDQKQITAWLDIRNDAAHAHYNNYDISKISRMIEGVREFTVRVTA